MAKAVSAVLATPLDRYTTLPKLPGGCAVRVFAKVARSVPHGMGRRAASSCLTTAAGCATRAFCVSCVMVGGAAVRSSSTGRFACSASSSKDRAVLRRWFQFEAASMSSSNTTAIGPCPAGGRRLPGKTGCASPKTSKVRAANLISKSQSGARAASVSFGCRLRKIWMGGKVCVRGLGGVALSSHQTSGRLSRPARAMGVRKIIHGPRYGACVRSFGLAGQAAWVRARFV